MNRIIRRVQRGVVAQFIGLNGRPINRATTQLRSYGGRSAIVFTLALCLVPGTCLAPFAYAADNVVTDDLKGRSGADVRLDEGIVETPYGGADMEVEFRQVAGFLIRFEVYDDQEHI